MRKPDFNNILDVLKCKVPCRPTPFEFMLNLPLMSRLAGTKLEDDSRLSISKFMIQSFGAAGYDFAVVGGSAFCFPVGVQKHEKSVSLNEGALINDRASFEKYIWPDPEKFSYSELEKAKDYLPDGMKLIVCGPCGILENFIKLVGYDNLCFMLVDAPELVKNIFDSIGSRLVKHYRIAAAYDTVGALVVNDDWGFRTQTMISPADLRKYVIPWHKKMVEVIHEVEKPAIMHSCGKLDEVMEDIIEIIKFDGKHSYEDTICPVEVAYDKLGGRIAVMGGIDVDFLCRASPSEITKRSKAMLEKGMEKGGYALGSGNSIAEYIPCENYFAMMKAVIGMDYPM